MAKKILYVVGLTRAWAISHRAHMLAAKLAGDYSIDVRGKGDLPLDGDRYDIIHLHTPCMLEDIRSRHYMDHPCWGIEIISVRSNGQIPRLAPYMKKMRFCVAKNPRLGRTIAEYMPCPITYLPNGVDERMFYPHPIRIGWAGNHRDDSLLYKGVPILREAVEKLAHEWRKWTRVEFVIDPGDGPRQIATHREMAAWYRTLDVYCSASEAEGCSNTLLEALACGLPVVTTDTGIVPELGPGMVVVAPRNVGGFVDALRRVLEPQIERRKRICTEYTWKIVAAGYRRLYRELVP